MKPVRIKFGDPCLMSYLIEVRGLKLRIILSLFHPVWSYLIEVRGLKPDETANKLIEEGSYLIEVRGLKPLARSGYYLSARRIL